jgi:mRNA-degrading endonuclease RelE of RelBE toxin-antitoxin system
VLIISKKKLIYPVAKSLRKYLHAYDRETKLPVQYKDLIHYTESVPYFDKNGVDTLWQTVMYEQSRRQELNDGLTMTYALLKTDGDISVMEHLQVSRIDYCTFGNTNPFRIQVQNRLNDNYDYFYMKQADASRIYGLELEHILSPSRINYLVNGETLIEEHIAGIPGDVFIKEYLERPNCNKVRIAKEFVKFNERCFIRLLGDMRSYNYVVDVTPDFEDEQYRVRSIDFDQQSYEGKKIMYLPQFFKENNKVVELVTKLLKPQAIQQYQSEERTSLFHRLRSGRYRLKDLIDIMRTDTVSTPEKTTQLAKELSQHHNAPDFLKCKTMGDIVRLHLKTILSREPKIRKLRP